MDRSTIDCSPDSIYPSSVSPMVQPSKSFQHVEGQLKDGDTQAAARVYHRYVNRLLRLARARMSNQFNSKFDPDDIVQSAFRSFFRRHADGHFEIDGWNNLWSLLATITVRKCLARVDNLNTRKRDIKREYRAGGDELAAHREILTKEPTPEQLVILEETLQGLTEPLTERQRQVVFLKLERYSNEEISKMIGRTERTVGRILSVVRKRLESMVEELE